MNEQEMGFRTAVVGGFQKDDVLQYIEESAKTYEQKLAALQDDCDKQKAKIEEQAAEITSLTEKNAELLERLGGLTLDLDKSKKQADELERSLIMAAEETNIHTARYDDLKKDYDEQRAECERLRQENERLQARSDEYAAARDHLAAIELEAHQRARQLEEQARQNASKIEEESARRLADVRTRMEQAKSAYCDTLRRTQAAADEARRKTEDILKNMETDLRNQAHPLKPAPHKPGSVDTTREKLDGVLSSIKPSAQNGGK